MNHQVGEIRNMLVLMSKRLEGLEQKVNNTYEISNKAVRISQIVQEFQIKNIHDQINDTEFNKIHKLFSGATPCLEESIVAEESDSDEDILGNLGVFAETEVDEVEEAKIRAYEVACAAASDATRAAMQAIATVAAMPNLSILGKDNITSPMQEDEQVVLKNGPELTDIKGNLVSSMTNQLLSDLYQPSDSASSKVS
jgi:hypothetical protein